MPHASSGPARVLATGTVTTFDGFPLVLGIDHPLELEIELRFLSDPAVPDVALRDIGQAGRRISWELVNFDGPDGRGSAAPVLVADTGENRIYLHFRVFRYGRTLDRTVHYTFYQVAGPART
ncbi:MAG: hypothetical protein H0V89_00135 [Deltaproteobacteria bacterium]|nr:hypothetical protein [Deltaproteobacteria bacterium]